MTTEKLSRAEAWDYDRRRLSDLANLLRAIGCVLSGTALLLREIRHLPPLPRRNRQHPPKQSRRKTYWSLPFRKETTDMKTTLYRPVGPEELALIAASDYREFPPRLPDQPIFYPVTNEEYATRIARDWNVKASGAGFVTRFEVRSDYLAKYRIETVGSSVHQEYWIPAAELPLFNAAIVGQIEVVAEFHAEAGTE